MNASAADTTLTGMPLLTTKLFAPKWRSELLARPRLTEQLQRGAQRKLTLVSASAGFGKSTLLSEFLHAAQQKDAKTAWVSLDKNDNDPSLFWAYFIAALESLQPGIGDDARALLSTPQPTPIESVLTTLINQIHGIKHEILLLLDDYHVIDNPEIHSGIEFLLDHLPPQMHLVLASRSDPPLPLARMRARAESLELRASDLSFSSAETASFLNDVMGLNLAPQDVQALEMRTEGWIAGLQLAALSMHGRQDIHGFVSAFAGTDRFVVDYLVEEVLQRQSEEVRTFLLQTSILERLSGGLCDAVIATSGSKALLEALEKRNLFVISLDDSRSWYRYHHLFADVLQAHLAEEYEAEIREYHMRASRWFEENGHTAEAIGHAVKAQDFEHAAGLIELAAPSLFAAAQSTILYRWLERLPQNIAVNRPVLSVWHAWAQLDKLNLDAADICLTRTERWLEDGTQDKNGADESERMVVADRKQIDELPAMIATARAFYSQARGDTAATEKYARLALNGLPDSAQVWRGGATALLGLAAWSKGKLNLAFQSFTDGLAMIKSAGSLHFQCTGTHVLADIRIAQGRLREARQLCLQSLDLLASWNGPVVRGTADIYLELAELHREFGDLQAATDYWQQGIDMGEAAALSENLYRWPLAESNRLVAQGDLQAALTKLEEAERLFVHDAVPTVRPLAALKVRLWLKLGRLQDAITWVAENNLTVDGELNYINEFEHTVLARVLIERYRRDGDDRSILAAIRLLERLLLQAESQERGSGSLDILLTLVLAYHAKQDTSNALRALERALTVAEAESFVRIFLDEGPVLQEVLMDATTAGIGGAYARRLLAAFKLPSTSTPRAAQAETSQAAQLVEPLTGRELEIVRLIAAGSKNQEIADHLFISLHTVKRHIANAYGKLGVSRREEAIARALATGLL